MLITLAAISMLTGCHSQENIITYYDENGKITKTEQTGNYTPLYHKLVNGGTQVNALRLLAIDTTSGNLAPSLIAGGSASAVQATPAFKSGETNPPMYIKITQNSLVDEFLAIVGLTCGGNIEAYTGVAGESADDTTKRLTALRNNTTEVSK